MPGIPGLPLSPFSPGGPITPCGPTIPVGESPKKRCLICYINKMYLLMYIVVLN